jgi:hypothetical protein
MLDIDQITWAASELSRIWDPAWNEDGTQIAFCDMRGSYPSFNILELPVGDELRFVPAEDPDAEDTFRIMDPEERPTVPVYNEDTGQYEPERLEFLEISDSQLIEWFGPSYIQDGWTECTLSVVEYPSGNGAQTEADDLYHAVGQRRVKGPRWSPDDRVIGFVLGTSFESAGADDLTDTNIWVYWVGLQGLDLTEQLTTDVNEDGYFLWIGEPE